MKNKILLINLFIFLISFALISTPALANIDSQDQQESTETTNNDELSTTEEDVVQNNISTIDENGDEVFFENEEDKQMYINNQNKQGTIQPRAVGVSQKVKTISKKRYNMRFSGYSNMTPNWSKASKYTIPANRSLKFSVGATYGGVNINLSFGKTYGVNTTIKANSKKYSRLAGYQDVTLTKKQRIYYQAGTKIKTVNFVTKKTHAKYVKVKYK
ncbi:hypothetical protein [Mammaliicoccus sciuri]|uniref:hypothetical protein n=1 Tax=Mammaliicoccus sciuri TaxID=1296 RepID=UPI003F563052